MLIAKTPSLCLSPQGERGRPNRPLHQDDGAADSLSHPHPLADAGYSSGKLAKASLLGEGWGEGVLFLF